MDDRVSTWLKDLGLDQYREAFQQQAVTWDVLPELNDQDLIALGVLLGHRKKLLRAIAQLSPRPASIGEASAPIAGKEEPAPALSGQDQGERRRLTVMFCDLAGSTALACRLDPEDLQAAIRGFLDACSQAIGRFNGYIAKYMGDGLLAYFGYPQAHEHDAERAVHAGLAVLELVKVLPRDHPFPEGFDPAVRIGIATGPVMVGELIGTATAKERSVFGETPNLAARLQGLAAPNQLIVDSATKRLVGGEFEFADHGTFALKGFSTPVQAWRALRNKPSASRFESYRAGRMSGFVGREHETALLMGRWREAADGEGQVVLLSGEAGIGKSRLIRYVSDRLAGSAHALIQFQCSPHHTDTVLYPAITALRQMTGMTGEDGAETQRQKLHDLMAAIGLDDPVTVALIAELMGISADDLDRLPALSPERRKDLTLEALVQSVHRLADRSPVLFVVEDAHWLDPTTLDFLTRMIDRIQQMHVLLVVTFRPDFKPMWADSGHVTCLSLNRLPRRQSAELIAEMTRGKALPPEVQQAVLVKTDGIPLYIEELTENLLASGMLTEGTDSFSLNAQSTELAIPDSLQALLMERIDRLGSAKDIVQIGAAIGREFDYELLREAVDLEEGQLEQALRRLVTSGLIFQEGDMPSAKFQFKHALLQDAAYHTLPRKSRRSLHARLASALESKFAERVKAEPELLAYHYEQAGLIGAAVEYRRLAARRDAERSADIEALSHFNRALALLKELPEGPDRDALELDLLIARGAPMVTLKGYASDEIEQNYRRARELSKEDSLSDQHFLSVWGLWVFHLVRGPLARASDLAEALLSLARRRQIPDLLVRAHESVGSTDSFIGRFDEAKIHLEAATADPGPCRSHALPYTQDPGITARIMLARTLWIVGEVERVELLVSEAIGKARDLAHPFTLAFTLATTAWISSMLRDANRTLELTEEATAISTKYSFEVARAWAISSQGWALARNGDEKGLARLREGLAATQATGAALNNTYTLALLAESYLRYGRIDEGLDAVAEAQRLAETQGERFWTAELSRLKGELLLGRADPPIGAVEQCFQEALAIARSQHAVMLELRAATSMAKLLKALNRVEDARRLLGSFRYRFNERADCGDLHDAQTVLDQLRT
jgi:class 3 adenylate cyclase/tetratricopeptide (TPR) repeat protein